MNGSSHEKPILEEKKIRMVASYLGNVPYTLLTRVNLGLAIAVVELNFK